MEKQTPKPLENVAEEFKKVSSEAEKTAAELARLRTQKTNKSKVQRKVDPRDQRARRKRQKLARRKNR